MTVRLIVGLANPGKQYANTRHNAGAWFLDAFLRQINLTLEPQSKFHGALALGNQSGQRFYVLRPNSYMNESGRSVQSVMQFYKITPQEILVVHDELDFEPGVIRLKQGGGHGGHNGLRDIIACLGTPDFYRLRIGIGHPGHRDQVTGYVLGEPNQSDKNKIAQAIDEGLHVMDDVIAGDFEKAMRYLHNE